MSTSEPVNPIGDDALPGRAPDAPKTESELKCDEKDVRKAEAVKDEDGSLNNAESLRREESEGEATHNENDDGEYSDGWEEEEEEEEGGQEGMGVLLMKLDCHVKRLLCRQEAPELPSSVTTLRLPAADGRSEAIIYLIGTAHFSEVSNQEVGDLIQAVKPDRIVLELDHSRSNILFMDEKRLMEEAKSYNFAMFKRLAAQQGVSHGLMHYLLLRMSSSLIEQLGMAPGGEFRAAAQAASSVPGCSLYYGDRPVGLTLRRAFSQLSLFSRCRLALALLSSLGPVSRDDVERLKQSDLVEAMVKELQVQFPILGRVFVDERDRYLARAIYDFASLAFSHRYLLSPEHAAQPAVLVAVVGMGHVAGIARCWDAVEGIDRLELCSLPEPSRVNALLLRGLKWTALGGILYGGYCLLWRLAARFW